jgi:hypothetical protein
MQYDPTRGLPTRLALEIAQSYDLELREWKDEIRSAILASRAAHGVKQTALDAFDDYCATLAHRWRR